jgi:4-amino-4-deoxy-L-arabinose transferase-like glycosyltransferase
MWGDATGRVQLRLALFADRLVKMCQRFIATHIEGIVVFSGLVAFVVTWMCFWTISTLPLDVHTDASEALTWARHFAFSYKHPPMTGWLFAAWFAVFPHRKWAVDLLTVTNCALALAITWRLLRDHLDRNRAVFGLIALMLIPLYEVKAEVLNANTVMMPFWAATLLFYLRARRGRGSADAFLAGAFASLTLLGKYWAVFLLAGMAIAALAGPGMRHFWRSPAPYLMVAGAAIVFTPHVWWLLDDRSSLTFVAESVINHGPVGEALKKSALYILGALAYIVVPLIFLAGLRPSRAALSDIIWPADADRRQVWLLLVVPLILPALLNLLVPYRLTPDWTFPNWAALPIVLYGSRHILIDERSVARGGFAALVVTLAIIVTSPVIAWVRLTKPTNFVNRPHFQQIAERAESLAGTSIALMWGPDAIIQGLPFYLPAAERLIINPLSAEGHAAIASHGLLIVCVKDDEQCQKTTAALDAAARTINITMTRRFLGVSGSELSYQITWVPPASSVQGIAKPPTNAD